VSLINEAVFTLCDKTGRFIFDLEASEQKLVWRMLRKLVGPYEAEELRQTWLERYVRAPRRQRRRRLARSRRAA